ncbi:Coiled-coil domain-containing protein 56 [Zootermopsis nevadensis]|uniref:Cytochrome c oxidase assembly factor 3 n=1 Tax=Zootermopsis nevadensis TaxID=136037 RepID=A0A067RCG5_ZOONE|nr:Coiled-coil domain-containing protein 56 [Zootermopsis nevadensis]
MGVNEQMKKVDLMKDKANISRTTIDYMKVVEKENLRRVQALQKLRQRNIGTGLMLGAGVLGIYFYTIFAVRQEKFLDDFDEPATTSN